ncbi:uncharacterized protein TRIVIDRAFT_203765 [Trichoderma virens Gv29-8]|uniref:Uncharacterized protein n=1 Tax=Hypocrea virens (strain Gv29-8 / FGSC 10586) TaxID=413071 RepID=G9N1P2_HYPVG|nr:uncharacterized protein TRIVIDRAFT_203765 [Trichoderma virens Gv29-8]EHK19671.1 hypothetical protein TRIVIDRAFT_203765 [Trichoderma virens Gv29-8]
MGLFWASSIGFCPVTQTAAGGRRFDAAFSISPWSVPCNSSVSMRLRTVRAFDKVLAAVAMVEPLRRWREREGQTQPSSAQLRTVRLVACTSTRTWRQGDGLAPKWLPWSSQESVAWASGTGFFTGAGRRHLVGASTASNGIAWKGPLAFAVSSDRPALANHPRPHGFAHSLAGPPESTTPVPGSSGGLTG